MDAKTISVWLTILSAIGAIWARFVVLEEKSETQVKWITELSAESRRVQDRIEVLERDRVMLERVHVIELRLTAMEASQKARR